MTLTIPTTPEEWGAAKEWGAANGGKGPHLLVSRDQEGLPRWVGVDEDGFCESFDTIDGAILFAAGFILPMDAEHRALYDKPGQAKLWFERQMRRLESEERGDPNWKEVQ